MKSLLMLAICAAVLFAQPVAAEKPPNCKKHSPPRCSRVRDPVCGTNGITFPNECMLCLFNTEYNKGVKILRSGDC
ncbi:trypsin inhibitor ClTI-1-like [Narcine bancroftii]|uniref:trypsin inhibitor ClTI-1-like n=1 Tax=Narcine bancroftii TaxID=1343680 RepID=UPI0038317C89